jgi:integrase
MPGRTFYARYQRNGRLVSKSLGPWDPDGREGLTLDDARARVLELTRKPKLGTGITVRDLAERYLASDSHERQRTAHELERYLGAVVDGLGEFTKAADVTAADIADMLEAYKRRVQADRPHCTGKTAANRLLSVAKGMFAYAEQIGRINRSPATTMTRAVAGGREMKRDRVLTDGEIRQLWADMSPEARVCRFGLLTGARVSALCAATPKQIEGDRWTFLLKATRGLEPQPHWVHLSPL